jgi:argininosuccinate lyase
VSLWSGRVEGALDPAVWDFLRADDAELLPYDVEATREHAKRLLAAGILSDAEFQQVDSRLTEIGAESSVSAEDEDVHSAIERQLGELGKKIHAGRSRNDQVAAAFRLYVRDACAEADAAIRSFASVVLDRAESEAETPLPSYTHLQRASVVTVGHHLLAWVEMLERDLVRFAAADAAATPSPLGSAAAAGSTLALPPPEVDQVRNSLDGVADRDFALDYLYACAMLYSHLSRIGEELVLWSSSEFGFVKLPESAATGSSMMPHKLNPDVAELVRAKAGTMLGRLAGLLAVVKGLPLAYDRDLQEDKPPVFASRHEVRLGLAALAALVGGLELDRGRLAAAVADPLLRATDAAEQLVREGVPFREAHERVAGSVRDGTFAPPDEEAPRVAPGPQDVAAAVRAARERLRG